MGTVLNQVGRFLVRDPRRRLNYHQIIAGTFVDAHGAKMAVYRLFEQGLLHRSGEKGRMVYTRSGMLERLWVKAQKEKKR